MRAPSREPAPELVFPSVRIVRLGRSRPVTSGHGRSSKRHEPHWHQRLDVSARPVPQQLALSIVPIGAQPDRADQTAIGRELAEQGRGSSSRSIAVIEIGWPLAAAVIAVGGVAAVGTPVAGLDVLMSPTAPGAPPESGRAPHWAHVPARAGPRRG